MMETASFSGFLRILLYMVAFYYIFKFLARLFLPLLVKKAVEKAGENFQQQQNRQYQNQQNTVNVDSSKSSRPKETKKVGEYVDYEEID